MAYVIPTDSHVVGDPNHTPDHNNITDVLGLLASTVAATGNSDAAITSPPSGNAQAVTAMQAMLAHRTGYFPWRFSVVAFGAVGDGQMVTDGAVSVGAPTTLTCATSLPFSSLSVGKAVIVNGVAGAGSAGTGTITGYTSPGVVTVTWAVTPTTTVTAATVLFGTDDTAAFQAAINAATTYMTTNYAAEVYKPHPPAGQFYMIAGPLVNTGSANSQLTIPNPDPAGTGIQQWTLSFSGDILRSQPLWTQQAQQQVFGAVVSTGVFASTSAETSNFNSFSRAAVLGSTPATPSLLANVDGFAAFANVHVIVENWTIITPSSANGIHYSAFSLAGCCKGEFRYCSALLSTNYFDLSGDNQFPPAGTMANGRSCGFILPANGNNATARAEFSVTMGYSYGFSCGEHTVLLGCGAYYGWAGILLNGNDGNASNHMVKIVGLSAEGSTHGFYINGSGAAGTGFFIDADIDSESLAANGLINDNNSGGGLGSLYGEIRCYGNYAMTMFPTGYPTTVKLHSVGAGNPTTHGPGWVFGYTGFSTAGTTVAVQNPYWRDCFVYYSGGTVASVSAGVTQGGTGGSPTTAPAMTTVSTAASGSIPWPPGGWLSFAFTGSPTWNVLVGS